MKNNYLITVFLLFLTNILLSQVIGEKKEFTSLKEALKNPEKVYKLNLSNQQISLTIAEWAKFINLEKLTLKNDHLLEFPIGILNLQNIKYLDISGNDFKTLPKEFSALVNLEELYLNNEKNIDLPATLSILTQLPKLKSLHLEEDNLTILPSEILKFKNLENLYLNKNKLAEVPKLEALDHLKYLDLKDNNINADLQEMKNLNFGFKVNF